ncbi:MAG: helix-turn-helix transcriptional regulator [Candidatus Omnitrophota bacterium]|jgi:transcriptional regulator with XRE-family HTH domain
MGKGIPNLGENIRKIRFRRGMEQDELANKANITQSHLSKIETGESNPSLKTLKRIAKALSVDEKTFFPDDIEPISLDDEKLVFGHIDSYIRQFISKSDSIPFLELAKDLYEGGFTKEELDALKLIFLSRKNK